MEVPMGYGINDNNASLTADTDKLEKLMKNQNEKLYVENESLIQSIDGYGRIMKAFNETKEPLKEKEKNEFIVYAKEFQDMLLEVNQKYFKKDSLSDELNAQFDVIINNIQEDIDKVSNMDLSKSKTFNELYSETEAVHEEVKEEREEIHDPLLDELNKEGYKRPDINKIFNNAKNGIKSDDIYIEEPKEKQTKEPAKDETQPTSREIELQKEVNSLKDEMKNLQNMMGELIRQNQQKSMNNDSPNLNQSKNLANSKEGQASADAAEQKQPEKRRPEPLEGVRQTNSNYKEEAVEESLISSQAREVHKINTFADSKAPLKTASKEFKAIMKDLSKLDRFMETINGRTRLTPEEMEEYDKLTLKVYNATKTYQNMKEKEKEARVSKRKKEKKSDYDEYRRRTVDTIQESVSKMRKDMFENRINQKINELETECIDNVHDLEDERAILAETGAQAKSTELKEKLRDNISQTLYYANRMESLKNAGDLAIKPGESLDKCMKRLDKSIVPRQKELDDINKSPMTKQIVDKGVKMTKEGQALTGENIKKSQNVYLGSRIRQRTQEKEMQANAERAKKLIKEKNIRQRKRELNNKKDALGR